MTADPFMGDLWRADQWGKPPRRPRPPRFYWRLVLVVLVLAGALLLMVGGPGVVCR